MLYHFREGRKVPSLFPAFVSQMAQGQLLERRFGLFNQELKFQIIGPGWWEAEEGFGFYFPTQKGNVGNTFQTQKLEAGLSCTLN